jgi:FlaA1/EpsC-like NDP-sugar epimerase
MGNGGEIFVLEMGKQIKILDLAQDMIRLSGFKSDEMPIIFTGLRKGEKLYEETFAYDERLSSTRHKKIMVAYYSKEKLSFAFDDLLVWLRSIESMDEQKIKTDIIKWIPEYINSK